MRVTAKQFLEKFLESYRECRKEFGDDQWERMWEGGQWNGFMMWTTGQPEPLRESVLVQTAEKLGLFYAEGEPLTFDAVLHGGRDPDFAGPYDVRFPMLVVIEHENERRGIWREMQKLLSVRSPLKVLITYTEVRCVREQRAQEGLKEIGDVVKGHWERACKVLGREEATEYLILVGDEPEKHTMSWHAMDFSGTEGPVTREFQPVSGSS